MKRPFEFEKRCIIILKSVIRWWLFCDCKGMDNHSNNTQGVSGILEVMYSTKTLPLPLWPADLLIQDRMVLLTPNSHPSNYCNSLSSTFGEHMWIVIWVIVAFLSVQSKLLLWTTRHFYTENCRSVDIFSFSDHSRLTVEIVGWKKYSKLTPPITSCSISHKSLFFLT